MGSNFRPRESRGLQDLGNPLNRESALFSDAPTRPLSYSNVDIQELATDNPEMSILDAPMGLNYSNRSGMRPDGSSGNTSYSVSDSRVPAPTHLPGYPPNTPTFSAYRRPIRENINPHPLSSFVTEQRRLFNRPGADPMFGNMGRRETRRDPMIRGDELPRWETLKEHLRGPQLPSDDSIRRPPKEGPREVPARRDIRGNTVSRLEQYNAQPLNLTHNQRRIMTEIYDDLRNAGFDVPIVPKLLPAKDIFMAFAHYFEKIAPLPEGFSPEPSAVLNLLLLLDYGKDGSPPEATIEPLTFALQLPDRSSTWPLVLSALNWIRHIAKDNDALDNLPELTDVDVSRFNFEQFLEYAEFSAYGLIKDNGEIETSFETELNASLQSCIEQEKEEITNLEADLKNVETVRDEVVMMSSELEKQPQVISSLESELSNLETETRQMNSEVMTKNQIIAELAGDLDIQTQKLNQFELEVNQLFANITENTNSNSAGSVITMEAALELARKYQDLQKTSERLQQEVEETSKEMSTEYERPAREKLTKVRISVDDYNNKLSSLNYTDDDEAQFGLHVPNDLLLKCEVPRTVTEYSLELKANSTGTPTMSENSVWGKSVSELLSTDQDLGKLYNHWLKLENFETQARRKVEDDSKEMEIEIPSLESRRTNNDDQLKKLDGEIQYLDSVKTKSKEDLVERRLKKESHRHEKEVMSEKWAETQRSINQVTNLIKKLTDEKLRNETKIQEKVPYKQRIEEALLDHQTARKILKDKIDELTEATEKMKPASEDAQQLIANLTPDLDDLPPVSNSPLEKALELLRTAGN